MTCQYESCQQKAINIVKGFTHTNPEKYKKWCTYLCGEHTKKMEENNLVDVEEITPIKY